MAQSWIGYSWTTPRAAVVPRIVSTHYGERPPWGAAGRIIHKLWVLDYARSDCGRARVGATRSSWWPRQARIAHLYPPGTPYWEDTSGVRGLVREAWAIFAGGEECDLRRLMPRKQRFGRIADPAGRLEAPLHDMALAGHTLREAGFWRAQAALAAIFDLLGSAGEPTRDGAFVLPPPGPPADSSKALVDAAQDYFRAHLGEKITLDTVARHLGVSPSALSHRYVEEADLSPMASLTILRIELAKSLLLRGLKMATIARQTGFFDAFHFSKAFKKHCGLSPSQFRRQSWQFTRPDSR